MGKFNITRLRAPLKTKQSAETAFYPWQAAFHEGGKVAYEGKIHRSDRWIRMREYLSGDELDRTKEIIVCGIAGQWRRQGKANIDLVGRMASRLESRGPDASGVWGNDQIVFGHRRLSIIDLSPKGAQPMVDNELGLSIVYNGEIYNYQEIMAELEKNGYRFHSHSDTEVLLKAYHCWGDDFVTRLNGMFAFCIYQRDERRLVLGRDRLGIKPLYYSYDGNNFLFSSSIPSLLEDKSLDRSLDPQALHYYMTFHAVVPAPHTILKAVKKVKPGSLLTINRDGRLSEKRYWEAQYERSPETVNWDEAEWEIAVTEKLKQAVKRRLVADVPVGLFLSGGVDSSLLAALIHEQNPDQLQTFSVGFGSAGGEQGNEFKYSDIVAEKYSTQHHKISVGVEELLEALPGCFAAMSEPMVSHDNVGFYLLSKMSSEHVKVVQSGQGADEVFAGYGWYPPMLDTMDAFQTYQKNFFDRSHEELTALINHQGLSTDFSAEFVQDHFNAPGAQDPLDKALRLDCHVMLVDDPVKRVDNMTMAWGLEARVPFLDHELIEMAAQMPAAMKIKDHGKYLLRKIAKRYIPKEVIDRPKGYFPVPQLKYLSGPFLEMAKETLMSPECRQRNLFNFEQIDQWLKEDPKRHITPLGGSKLWQVLVLEKWLQVNEIN